MMKWVLTAAVLMLAVCAATVACNSSNDCQAYYQNLCSHDSYKSDKDEQVAKARQNWCTCITDGPDKLDNDYEKLDCSSNLEATAALDRKVPKDADTLRQCRVRNELLSEFKDAFITTCFQTDGKKDCSDKLRSCSTDCGKSCASSCGGGGDGGTGADYSSEDCQNCLTACTGDCDRQYPCSSMCG